MGYVIAGFAVTLLGLGGYAMWVVHRAHRLSRPGR